MAQRTRFGLTLPNFIPYPKSPSVAGLGEMFLAAGASRHLMTSWMGIGLP